MPAKSKSKSETPKKPNSSKLKRGPWAEWNILFYIAGDWMLSSSMVLQLKQITDAGFQQDARVLVYFDPNCNGIDARIFDVNNRRKKKFNPATQIGDDKDSFVRNIAEDCHVTGLPQIPSALSLRYFLEYARFAYPAKNYMVFLVGHGVIVGNDSFLPDEDDSSAITLTQLSWILDRFARNVRAEKSEFHLVGFHSCSMNSVELAYQLKGSARYMIGTQGAAFPGSWPYRQVLKKIYNTLEKYRNSGRPAVQRGRNVMVEEMLTGIQDLSYYNSKDFWFSGYSADLSLCSLDKNKVNALTNPLSELSRALQKGLSDAAARKCILLAHWDSQSYWGEAYSDLFDLCKRLQNYCKDTSKKQVDIKNACEKVMRVLSSQRRSRDEKSLGDFSRLVIYSDFYGPDYQFSHGLSIYFPWTPPTDKVAEIYRGYDFSRKWRPKSDSWWGFLNQYFALTKRPLAGQPGSLKVVPAPGPPPGKPPAMGLLERLSDTRVLLIPAKGLPALAPPNKSPAMEKPPNKPPAMEKPPNKPPTVGLAGFTVIKNFTAPRNRIISSRPYSDPRPPGKGSGKGRKKASKKRGKPAKAK